MHEATIAQSILNLLRTKFSHVFGATAVSVVQVAVGEFRNVDEGSLRFAFNGMRGLYDEVTNCALEIETIPAQAWCNGHKHKYRPDFNNAYRCTYCGDSIGELIQGEELHIVNIEMEIVGSEAKVHA